MLTDKTTQGESLDHEWPIPEEKLRRKLAVPSQGRLYYIRYAMKMGWSIDRIYELTKIDRWFLGQMKELVDFEAKLELAATEDLPSMDYFALTQQAKQWGYSDVQLAHIDGMSASEARNFRQNIGVVPVYKLVDTCAAEFEASTPYYYSTYERPFSSPGIEPTKTLMRQAVKVLQQAKSLLGTAVEDISPPQVPPEWIAPTAAEDEIRLTRKAKVIIIGGGPNRIGQGIEFDYCCVQAAFAMKELGLESVMINSNPETVSTDYDTSDLLFFEPLTHEDILNICERLNGGPFDAAGRSGPRPHRSIRRADAAESVRGLKEAGVPILGTTVESLDEAGDREQFRALLQKLNLKQPVNGIARSVAGAAGDRQSNRVSGARSPEFRAGRAGDGNRFG